MHAWGWPTKVFSRNNLFCLTSKMSHAHGRHDSCGLRLIILRFRLIHPSLAGGVTDVGVGSGALFGVFFLRNGIVMCRLEFLVCLENLRRREAGETGLIPGLAGTLSDRTSRGDSLLPDFSSWFGLLGLRLRGSVLPNVKDEPRPRPARLLRPSIAHPLV